MIDLGAPLCTMPRPFCSRSETIVYALNGWPMSMILPRNKFIPIIKSYPRDMNLHEVRKIEGWLKDPRLLHVVEDGA